MFALFRQAWRNFKPFSPTKGAIGSSMPSTGNIMHDSGSQRPELIIGLVGPIGCDIERVQNALSRALRQVSYTTYEVSLSKSISGLLKAKTDEESIELSSLREKIEAGNRARRLYESKGLLAAEAIRTIREIREEQNLNNDFVLSDDNDDPSDYKLDSVCYLLRQLKRPEEVEVLQRTYGKNFLQVSVTEDKQQRLNNLSKRLRREHPGKSDSECEAEARDLVGIDENEDDDPYGQKISKIFHLGDVFINSGSEAKTARRVDRFINALFGRTDISPTRDEFGSYFAKAASLRSADLSRQVGAAIFTPEGDIISTGCNEVPKSGGGSYWYDDEFTARDIDLKGEANKEETNRIVHSFLKALANHNLLNSSAEKSDVPKDILSRPGVRDDVFSSMIGEITEYGRMVHAEMSAISDASRLGRSLKNATLYVTTFPCHNCAKHIVACGISRVVFIEPYPKSRAESFYRDSISLSNDYTSGRVSFVHFEGISPRRYGDIFEKGKRRSDDGEIHQWYKETCSPLIGNLEVDYTGSELHAIYDNIGE